MKHIAAFVLAVILTFALVLNVNAQAAETIWLEASTVAYKTGETVVVTVKAITATPIQGFTFQIRYDPACLQPVNASSPIPGMNGLSLPQTVGLVDASFASTTPQTANGVLAEVQFTALSGCQTDLVLESAALAIRNESGFAAPLTSVTVGEKNIALNIDSAVGESQPQTLLGTPLPLGVDASPSPKGPNTLVIAIVVVLFAMILFGAFIFLRKKSSAA
ncbi:MAG: cohesin domain-containing protein [Chloroflexota bacterium]